MPEINFLHIADIHLDSPFSSMRTHIGSKRRDDTLRDEIKKAMGNLIDYAIKNSIDVILIAGDLFEAKHVTRNTIEYLNIIFEKANEIDICITPGNHDPASSGSYYMKYKWAKNVHILTRDSYVYENNEKGFRVYGVGFYEEHVSESLVSYIKDIKRDSYASILVYHGDVLESGQSRYSSTTKNELISMNMDYIALGHIHANLNNLLGIPNCNYSGVLQPLSFSTIGETGALQGNIKKYNNEQWHTTTKFVKFNLRQYVKIDYDIGEIQSYISAKQKIKDYVKTVPDIDKNIVWITLKGSKRLSEQFDTDDCSRELNENCFSIRLKDSTKTIYNFDDFEGDTGVIKEFVGACKEAILRKNEAIEQFKKMHEITDEYIEWFRTSNTASDGLCEADYKEIRTDNGGVKTVLKSPDERKVLNAEERTLLADLINGRYKEEQVFLHGISYFTIE